ncbi:hypothetical protein [Gloeobacter kilaueensis]|uniref:Uncharacterized protein n=1 Tax=Gloeobacter kilaueensis (strain ATCC BAA-2537 / CCAP 1431/1 / ULC 316 / JS1) TaxID=1183438 RepID=U5QPR2_GLOK1|nr:hypothetical protein [Gloeobacter kilaueensis]AGY59685.1 hypothetical protein GKIL_3439 [Gloeobacter kilaueensis JS1]
MRWWQLAVGLGSCLGAVNPQPAWAGKVIDQDLSVSFTPPPYFQTTKQTTPGPVHFVLVPPDKSVTISTGAQFDRKLHNAPPFSPAEAKALCNRAAALVPKGLVLKQSNRFVLDSQNGVECQFTGSAGRTVHWIGAPVPAQLVMFFADWPKPPSKEQVATFRQFLGGVQIF